MRCVCKLESKIARGLHLNHKDILCSTRPFLPAAQDVHDEADGALDFPTSQVAHSLSALLSVRLWSRYVPAGQPVQGLAVGVTSSVVPSYLLPAWQTLHRVRPLSSANVRLGHDLHCVLSDWRVATWERRVNGLFK